MDSAGDKVSDSAAIGDGFRQTLAPVAEGEIDGATFIFKQLEKAATIQSLYPADNRIRIEFMDRLHENFVSFLKEHREIPVSIEESTFTYKGRVVYREPNLRKALPMRFFRDGIRRLVFYDGFERAELINLLEVLNLVATTDEFDDDAVTLLWEKDFANLSYAVIEDPFEDEEEDDLSGAINSQDGAPSEDGPQYIPPKLSPNSLASVLTITDHDLSVARTLISREQARKLRHDLTTLLFELLTLRRADEESFAQTVELLSRISLIYVKSERLGEAAEVLRKFREVQELPLSEHQQELIHAEFQANRQIEVIRHVQRLFDRPTVRNPRDIAEFLRLLGPEIVPELMRMITTARNPKILAQVMFELDPRGAELLLRKLNDRDPETVRRMVQVLGSLEDPQFLPALLLKLDHPVMAVRLAVVRAVASIDGTAARRGLLVALKNSEFQIRVQALKGLETRSDPMVLPLLRELVNGDEFRMRGAPEQQEFLFALARIGQEESVPVLKWLLDQAGRFSRTRTRRLAECAAAALGRIAGTEAREALQGCRSHRTVVEACQVALGNQDFRARGEEEE